MTGALFEPTDPVESWPERLGPGTVLLHGFALAAAPALMDELARIAASAPFRHMITPSGHRMSVAMTNCGALGWVSDRTGYRYL
jgi:alkylated DNA repair protein (DNA oxidative demethylase)